MAEVKWIKLNTAMFDNSKIKYIRTLPEGNNMVLIWVMLLSKAGKCNSNGFIFLTENIPYTPQMLAAEFGYDAYLIELALGTFANLNMIQLEDHIIKIAGWEEHQNIDGLDRIREQTRKRVAKYRENQKQLPCNVTDNVTVTSGNAIEEEREEDIDINNISKDILSSNKLLPVIEAWNKLSLSKLVAIKPNTNRYKMLKARINEFGIEKVIEAIESINNSDFLKGQNDRSWVITFDWLIKPNNFTKVLEGNYLNKGGNMNGQHNNRKHSNRWGSGKNKTILNVNTESQYGELSDEDRRKAEELI
ncbi:phage replisome organizer N-terminal domain-containing protein [uncultured Clostridium sp.]|uniref:phage replisome organizer N-terminal domain-containing protein n=1 Tax=uncultured Clostridium sp. TaxID=59620 RepID=UPI00082026A3|nr:phage replisome organizer N-terminal domain-containing protein [uncultured Clostridium sp.]SCJ91511.1 phage replisome organizer%2C putative%2C N-terminal region [uncultured Clostridium sp.]